MRHEIYRQPWTPHLVLHLAGVLNLSQKTLPEYPLSPILKQAIMQVIVKMTKFTEVLDLQVI